VHQAHRRRTPRQAIGPTILAVVALAAWGGLTSGGPSAAAGGPRPSQPAAYGPEALGARIASGSDADAGTRTHAAEIVETRSGEPLPTRPVVDVPVPEPGSAARLPDRGRVVVLGDSFSSGWNGAGIGSRGWPAIVAATRGWRVTNLAVAGTGFLNPGWTGQAVGSRTGETVRHRPDVVFVVAGHNDSRWSVAATAAAADAVIDRLRVALPDAVLVVVAPIWQDGSPPARALALRDRLRHTASAVGALFIDPLAERWFGGVSHRFIGSDGLHPTNAGHRYLAERILADLAKLTGD
jgi:lysophospholipase L1-like esterase